MGVTPRCVHDQSSRVRADCFSKGFGSFLDNDVTPTDFAGHASVERRAIGVVTIVEGWDDDIGFEARLTLRRSVSDVPTRIALQLTT